MGGRGPPRLSRFPSGFGKGGAEALLSFRVPAWSVRKGEGRGPLRLPHVRLAAGNRGAEATPAFVLTWFWGCSPKEIFQVVCARKPTQKKTIQFEDQTGGHAAESEDRFVRRAPRIDSKLICSFCLPACKYDLRSSNDQEGPARPIPGWVQLKIGFSVSAFLSRLKWGAEALLGFDVFFRTR